MRNMTTLFSSFRLSIENFIDETTYPNTRALGRWKKLSWLNLRCSDESIIWHIELGDVRWLREARLFTLSRLLLAISRESRGKTFKKNSRKPILRHHSKCRSFIRRIGIILLIKYYNIGVPKVKSLRKQGLFVLRTRKRVFIFSTPSRSSSYLAQCQQTRRRFSPFPIFFFSLFSLALHFVTFKVYFYLFRKTWQSLCAAVL